MSRLVQRLEKLEVSLTASRGRVLWGFAANDAAADELRRRAAAEGYDGAAVVRWASSGRPHNGEHGVMGAPNVEHRH